MRKSSPSPKSLKQAWDRIGRNADARQLFDEADFDPDHVVQFYEMLRSIPELRTAFQESPQETG